MLLVHRFVFNTFYENTYIIWDDSTKKGAVIDPGMYDTKEKNEFEKLINKHSIEVEYCINTHCHIDHIFGNSYIKENYKSELWIPKGDEYLLDIMAGEAQRFGVKLEKSPPADVLIEDNTILRLGELRGEFIWTPGHSPGEVCLYFQDDKILFTGDVLFKESIGRTDLWGGNFDTLMNSIRKRIMTLPDDVKVMPGHESSTTIGSERKHNSFLVG